MASAQRARKLGKAFILLDKLLVIFGFFMVFPLISLHFVDQLGWSASTVGLDWHCASSCSRAWGCLAVRWPIALVPSH
jgi:hypothetical protein